MLTRVNNELTAEWTLEGFVRAAYDFLPPVFQPFPLVCVVLIRRGCQGNLRRRRRERHFLLSVSPGDAN